MSGDPPGSTRLSADDLMADLRRRLRAAGGSGGDEALLEEAAERLREAVAASDDPHLLLPSLLGAEPDWRLQTHLRLTSHRGLAGRPIVWLKRRVLMPLARWLFEWAQANFRRQRRVNEVLFAAVERLALDNARLARRLEALEGRSSEAPPGRRTS